MTAAWMAEAFQLQAAWCRRLGSELYGGLLERAAGDFADGGVIARLVEGWSGNPVPDALVLRLMGAVHRIALAGRAPGLARFYPSTGGEPSWPEVWEAFRDTAEIHFDEVRRGLARGVQTNEVNRCAALLGGFLEVAAGSGLPLRLLELGSSAGLNQLWDRYRCALGEHAWGDPASPVLIRAAWQGALPKTATARVASRSGCDLFPVDVGDPDQALTLESFVWPDQLDRLALLRAAIAVAKRDPPAVERENASTWLERELAFALQGVATVVFHSIFWWYLPEPERDAVRLAIETAGRRATASAPLAWLRMEVFGREGSEVRLTTWPGGAEVLLAEADPHGRRIHWLAH
jgi:hypothetical protein